MMMTATGGLGDYQVTLPDTFSKKEHPMSDVTVYGIPGSPYLRSALLGLEEKGVTYTLVRMGPGETKQPPHLERHPFVEWVKYPGLASSPYYELGQRYLPKGCGAVLTFGIKGGMTAARAFIESVEVFSHLANIGDAKSLVLHPASTTHQQLPAADLEAAGVSPDMIRVSVGLEGIEDLIRDAGRALEASQKPRTQRGDRNFVKQKLREVLATERGRWGRVSSTK